MKQQLTVIARHKKRGEESLNKFKEEVRKFAVDHTFKETAKKFGYEDDYYSGNQSWWQKTKPKIWSIFDEPYSSSAAKV